MCKNIERDFLMDATGLLNDTLHLDPVVDVLS